MTETRPTTTEGAPATNRRQVLAGTGLAVAGVALLAGCGSGSSASAAGGPTVGTGNGGGGTTVPVSDVPVGGGTILQSPPVVVTQPTKGTFEAFSSICPHAGCPVTQIQGGLIMCPCHGSQFDIATGDVKAGPAPHGLDKLTATVSGDTVEVS